MLYNSNKAQFHVLPNRNRMQYLLERHREVETKWISSGYHWIPSGYQVDTTGYQMDTSGYQMDINWIPRRALKNRDRAPLNGVTSDAIFCTPFFLPRPHTHKSHLAK